MQIFIVNSEEYPITPRQIISTARYYGYKHYKNTDKPKHKRSRLFSSSGSYFIDTTKGAKVFLVDTEAKIFHLVPSNKTVPHEFKDYKKVHYYELIRALYSSKHQQLEQIRELKKEFENA